VVAEAESGEIDTDHAPATALLIAGGQVLAIAPEDFTSAEQIPGILAKFQAFCGNAFSIGSVTVKSLGVQQLPIEADEDDDLEPGEELMVEEEVLSITMVIDGVSVVTEVTRLDEMIDLGFVGDLQDCLEAKGDGRQLCPLVELMDETARFLFADPEKVEQAELEEIITAPDFEDEDDEE
jgi:hypothetical protein